MRISAKFLLQISLALMPAASSLAQSYEVGTLNTEINFPITNTTPNEVNYLFRGVNKLKQNFELNLVDAPAGLKVSIVGGMVDKNQDVLIGAFGSSLIPTKLFFGNNNGEFNYTVGGDSGGGTSTERDPNCGCLSELQIDYYIDLFKSYGQNYNRASLCAMVGNYPGGSCDSAPDLDTPTQPDTSLIKAFIQRNQCGKQDHFAMVKLDLSNVDKNANPSLKFTTKFKGYGGKKASSIKPLGEGMYRQPLFLGSMIQGSYSIAQQSVKLSRWNGTSRIDSKNIEIADIIYYGPVGTLLRVPLAYSLLTGGKGTFEVSSKGQGYSLCASLKAKRQYFYGYTN